MNSVPAIDFGRSTRPTAVMSTPNRSAVAVDRQLSRIKRDLSRDVRIAMTRKGVSQAELARRMGTSRSMLFRMLNTKVTSVQLRSIARIATALEGRIAITFSPYRPSSAD
jgi:DNA-binding Xre family transcriptional regulator